MPANGPGSMPQAAQPKPGGRPIVTTISCSAHPYSTDPVLILLAPEGLVDYEPNIPVMPLGLQNAASASVPPPPPLARAPVRGPSPSDYDFVPAAQPVKAPARPLSPSDYDFQAAQPVKAPARPLSPSDYDFQAAQPGQPRDLATGGPSMPSLPAQGNAPAWSFPARGFDINDVSTHGLGRVLKASLRTDADAVKKLWNDLQREKYRVEIGHTIKRRGEILDTAEVLTHFRGKNDKDPTRIQSANLGNSRRSGVKLHHPPDWSSSGMIWVCIPNEADKSTIYSHVGKRGRFHHSSLAGPSKVIGAGEWIVIKGKLRKISANSGHFRPTLDMLYHSVLYMSRAFQPDTTVFLYDSLEDKWFDYPVLQFIRKPSGGGRYWAHPDSPLL